MEQNPGLIEGNVARACRWPAQVLLARGAGPHRQDLAPTVKTWTSRPGRQDLAGSSSTQRRLSEHEGVGARRRCRRRRHGACCPRSGPRTDRRQPRGRRRAGARSIRSADTAASRDHCTAGRAGLGRRRRAARTVPSAPPSDAAGPDQCRPHHQMDCQRRCDCCRFRPAAARAARLRVLAAGQVRCFALQFGTPPSQYDFP
eukprot:SAG31_NODE_1236_length_9195_cov_6.761214_2_plen_201_part_00